jgi:hypothetical protein
MYPITCHCSSSSLSFFLNVRRLFGLELTEFCAMVVRFVMACMVGLTQNGLFGVPVFLARGS